MCADSRAHGSMVGVDDQSKPDPDDAVANDGGAETEAASQTKPAASDEPSPAALPDDLDATQLVTPDPDATKMVRPGDDATTGRSRPEAPRYPSGSGDATTVLRPQTPDATSIMPPSTARPSERWSGKANVPTGRPPRDPDATSQWQPPEPSRAWWLPILLAIVGLVLLIGIAFAVVTALNNSGSDTPSPTPPATPTTPSQVPSSTVSTPPTSPPPTTPTAAGTVHSAVEPHRSADQRRRKHPGQLRDRVHGCRSAERQRVAEHGDQHIARPDKSCRTAAL